MLDWWDSKTLVNAQLRGVFIGDKAYPELHNNIFLLYKFDGKRWFTALEQALRDCDEFVVSYDPSNAHVMFVYDVPIKFQKSYDNFKNSKYSLIGNELKENIIEFHGKERTEQIVAVIEKDEKMYVSWENKINEGLPRTQHIKIPRDQEATTALDMNIEVYDSSLGKTHKGITEGNSFLIEKGDGDAD